MNLADLLGELLVQFHPFIRLTASATAVEYTPRIYILFFLDKTFHADVRDTDMMSSRFWRS